MDARQTIHKALLLLDKEQGEQAVPLLQQLLQELDTAVQADRANIVRCAVILGEYNSTVPDKREATRWCAFALQVAAAYPELDDAVGYELERAAALLNELKQTPSTKI